MTTDSESRDQAYRYFLEEAPELLQLIEQNLYLLGLSEDQRRAKVHEIRRAIHTIKGSAAALGLETIKTIAHSFEDLVKSLYHQDLSIDPELQAMLMEGYECLRLPLMAQLTGVAVDQATDRTARATSVFAQLQTKLGEYFDPQAQIPSSAELGFDLVQSLFEVGVKERLEEIANILANASETEIAERVRPRLQVLVDLAESLDLPEFAAIAQTAITSLDANPEQAVTIAQIALDELRRGREQVLSDAREERTRGGEASQALQQLAEEEVDSTSESENSLLEKIWNSKEQPVELPSIRESDRDSLDESDRDDSIEIPLEPLSGSQNSLLERIWSGQEQPFEFPSTEELPQNFLPSSTPPAGPLEQPAPSSPPTVRVKLEELERLDYTAGELLINQNREIAESEQLQNAVRELRKWQKQHRQNINRLRDGAQKKKALEEAVHLEAATESMDQIARRVCKTVEKQQLLLSNLRDDLMEARMLPLGEVLNRFTHTVQQLGIVHRKSVDLKLVGTNVLVDKAIAEKLYAPLLHLVRNAFDHGIESVEVRHQQGKPETGQIEIHAYQQGGQTVIEVRDDGQGLDFERIRARAVDLNLLTAEQASRLSPEQLSDLLFEPGFSTAPKITDLSGRGIGLEVVKAQVQALKGTCAVRSQPYRGTTFSLKFPLTLMVVKLMVVRAGGMVYALSSDTIEKILLPDSSQIKSLAGQKVLIWGTDQDKSLVPVRKLSDSIVYQSPIASCLKNSEEQETPKREKSSVLPPGDRHLLLLRHGTKLLGLEVDQVLGEQETVIKPFGRAIAPPSCVYGCSILSNGRLALVIDGAVLIDKIQVPVRQEVQPAHSFNPIPNPLPTARWQEVPSAPSVARSQKSVTSPSPLTVLLVDNSISQRQTTALTLQKVGYQVLQARNGLDALEQMQMSDLGIQLVICEIEMPHLNGFELLSYCRQNPEWEKVPVVILTSRGGEKYRRIALGLGAAAYFTKPYLELDFLSAIADLTSS